MEPFDGAAPQRAQSSAFLRWGRKRRSQPEQDLRGPSTLAAVLVLIRAGPPSRWARGAPCP
eukprot:9924594-Alexandrium_andersonii.AAC.1